MSSSGGRGTYSIRIQLDAQQAISTFNQLQERINGMGPTLQTLSGAVNQSARSFEKYDTATSRIVGTSSAMSSSLGQVRGSLGQLNSQINTTVQTLPKMASAEQQATQASNRLNTAVQNKIQSISRLASRTGGISFLVGGWVTSMQEAQGMQELLEVSERKVEEQTLKVEEAIAKYGYIAT